MTGQWNGLIALLKKEQPPVVVVHCFAHGLELAFKDASDSNSLHEKVIASLLMGLLYCDHKNHCEPGNAKDVFQFPQEEGSHSYKSWWNPLGGTSTQGIENYLYPHIL